MSVQPNECDARMRTDDEAREEFDITIDTGDLDMENAPVTAETLRAITIRALDCVTLREWSATLEQISRELEDAPTSKHSLFTRASIVRIIARLIANKSVKITRVAHNEQLLATFTLSVQNEYLPEIKDEIALTLAPIAQTDTDLALKQMSARIAEQDKEIARMARIIATHGEFARMCKINERVTFIVGRYGPLSARTYELAQRIAASDVDGSPIIFRELGCDAPMWLRSVIRFVNTTCYEPKHHDWPSDDDEIIEEMEESRVEVHNRILSQPRNFHEWIRARSHNCDCDILVVLPLCDGTGDQRCFTQPHLVSVPNMYQNAPLVSKLKCHIPTVIFGNPYDNRESSATCSEVLNKLRTNVTSWLAPCKNVHHAGLTFSAPQCDGTKHVDRCLHQYSESIIRAYDGALDARDYLVGIQKRLAYPSRITFISGNIEH